MIKTPRQLMLESEQLKILHISDLHLFGNAQEQLLGVNTRESFQAVLEDISEKSHQSDIVVVTGDISQDLSAESYQYFYQQMQQLRKPVFCLAGNHDELQLLENHLSSDNIYTDKHIISKHWQILLLNSHVKGQVYGQISTEELTWLKSTLDKSPDLATSIFMHHHPIAVGCHWLDQIGLQNNDEFLALIHSHPQVKLCGFGHVHQPVNYQDGATLYSSVPSTCIQFKANSYDFAATTETPGYRHYILQADGSINQFLHRVDNYIPSVDMAISGY